MPRRHEFIKRKAIAPVHLVMFVAGALAAGAQNNAFIARPVLTFEYRGSPSLVMPTAVAVAADGGVFVADGVNNRVLHFDAAGKLAAEIRQVADETLSQPLNVRVDSEGGLWIVDTGNHRVLIRNAEGGLVRVVRPATGRDERALDPTDVLPEPGGQTAWLVDNDNHRLLRIELETGAQTAVGGKGESLGQFDHPFMLAGAPDGDLLVTDVINARVQRVSSSGRPAGALGAYGVDLGQLYRPKGVACDRDGNVWVSDSVLGVVQVFAPTGSFLDVLRDPDGKPLRLETPTGIALDARGNLYVAELRADRVRKFSITTERRGVADGGARAVRRPATTIQPRTCTSCHIEWLDPLAQGRGTELLALPDNPPEQPFVSQAETCLSCHDGSVVDSRRRVWQEHGHNTGIVPPPGMVVPPYLPLVAGRVACRTCHSAHGAGRGGDIAQAVFLRVPNRASELCISCHPDKTRGPELGTHPTGGMPWAIPKVLVEAGARVGPNPRELTCQVCHTPHGAAYDHLLVMGTESNELCLTCHDQMRPGMFREGSTEHPLSPEVNGEQRAAVQTLGTKVGPGDRLICLSCHKLHHGKGKRFMLAADLHDADLCLRCHSDRRELLGTAHDLRINFPAEGNRMGLTVDDAGPCSACHLFHRYARAPEASDLDPGGGKCITCHQPGRIAQTKILGDVNHTQARCTSCHNPHRRGSGAFLSASPTELCLRCHQTQAVLVGGPHDRASSTTAWPAGAGPWKDHCMPCHRPHGAADAGLLRAGRADHAIPSDGACLACHPAAMPGAATAMALVHPRQGRVASGAAQALLVATSDKKPAIGCRTCHDPHAGSGTPFPEARVMGASVAPVCVVCHPEAGNIESIGHADANLRAAGFATRGCEPCHVAHASPERVESRLLWPRQLGSDEGGEGTGAAANRHCVACHRSGGPVAPPGIATHPKADMFNAAPPGSPGYFPLFNAQGEIDPKGFIGCKTCHLTHGRSSPAPLPPDFEAIGSREARARQWHLRTFTPDTVCTTCHGFDALRRFMYFHDAARRTGPVEGAPPPGAAGPRTP